MNTDRHQRLKIPIHTVETKTVAELFKVFPQLKRYFANVDLRVPSWKQEINTARQMLELTDELDEDIELTDDEVPANANEGVGPAAPYWPGDQILKLMKYVVYLYDEGTDLTDEYPDDVRLRKEAAAKEAGFKRDGNGEWPVRVQDVMDFKDPLAIELIMSYLQSQRNIIWREIKMIEEELEMFYRQRSRMVMTGKIGTKDDLLELTKKRMDEKDDLLKKFYGAHHDLRDATERKLLPVSPENVFSEMEFPIEFTRITQIRDVPAEARPY